MAENEVKVEITVEEKQAIAALTKISKSLDEFGNKAKAGVGKADIAIAAFAANIASAAVTGGLKLLADGLNSLGNSVVKFTREAMTSQQAVQEFNTALALTGKFTEKNSNSFTEYAGALQKTTKYSDEAILSAGTLIQTMASLDENGLKRATAAALDMSSALGIDLNTASRIVGKSLEGNVEALSRYGINIKIGTTVTENFNNVLAALEGRFSGAAAANAMTFSGSLEIMKNQISEVAEALGGFIIKSPALINFFTATTEMALKFIQTLNDNRDAFQAIVDRGINYFIQGIQGIIGIINLGMEGFAMYKQSINSIEEAYTRLSYNILIVKDTILGNTEAVAQDILQRNALLETLAAESAELEKQNLERQLWFANLTEGYTNINTSADAAAQKHIQSRSKQNVELKKLSDANAKNESNASEKINEARKKQNETYVNDTRSTLSYISTLQSSSNSALFAIGKASALATATIDGYVAVQKALTATPWPPVNFALAALVGVATAANIAKIASTQPPKFAMGGIVPGNSYSGDSVTAMVNSGEMVLTRGQQNKLFNQISGTEESGVVGAIQALGDRIAGMNIIVQANSRGIARLVRDERAAGFAI